MKKTAAEKRYERQSVRIVALREVVQVLGIPSNYSTSLELAHRSNRYMDDRYKELVTREYERLRWQLARRLSKLEEEFYSHD